MSNYSKVTIDHLIGTIKKGKERNLSVSVLMGAGMSVSAGIPLAGDIVKDIRKNYNHRVDKLSPDSKGAYQLHMAELSSGERRDLIRDYVKSEKVKLNWGHIFLAQLINAGYIDRVLTVNFDNLLAQAFALFGIFPAIYDFADSEHFDGESVSVPSIFHLHGQMQGFTMLHYEGEVKEQKENKGIELLFENTKINRTWVIIGYSGDCDPVLERLAEFEYSNHLYWVGYEDHSPSKEVQEKILSKKCSHFISNYNSDSFFDELRNKLGCEFPDFAAKPFSHMKNIFYQKITGLGTKDLTTNPLEISIKWVDQAIETFEDKVKATKGQEENKHDEIVKDSLTQQAIKILIDNDYDELETFYSANKEKLNEGGKHYICYAFINIGVILVNQGEYKSAIEKYQKAIQIKPNYVESYTNLLETLLLTNNKLKFYKVLQNLRSNCYPISSRKENIVLGLELLAEIQWEQISKESVKNFPANNPPVGWSFDFLERFYKQIKKAETKKRVRLVLDAWQGKIPPEQFKKEASKWVSDSK